MDEKAAEAPVAEQDDVDALALAEVGHPKGTLAIMILYFLLFVAGWAALYFELFLPRTIPAP